MVIVSTSAARLTIDAAIVPKISMAASGPPLIDCGTSSNSYAWSIAIVPKESATPASTHISGMNQRPLCKRENGLTRLKVRSFLTSCRLFFALWRGHDDRRLAISSRTLKIRLPCARDQCPEWLGSRSQRAAAPARAPSSLMTRLTRFPRVGFRQLRCPYSAAARQAM